MHRSRRPWRKLLDRRLAKHCLDRCRDIGSALLDRDPPGISFFEGKLGVGLALLQASDYLRAPSLRRRGGELFQASVSPAANLGGQGPSLFAGVAGAAVGLWVAHHHGWLAARQDSKLAWVLPEILVKGPGPMDFDLVGGVAGIGAYGLLGRSRIQVGLLHAVVRHLWSRRVERPDGICWAGQVGPGAATAMTRGYDTGVAHGTAGLLPVLAGAARLGVPRAATLFRRATAWLLAHERKGNFPYLVSPADGGERPSRSAWCYGSPGVAVALLHAARQAQNPALERRALALTAVATRRAYSETGVIDPGVCHGAAGQAHLYNCIYQATGSDDARDASIEWFRRLLDWPHERGGIGGYLFSADGARFEALPGVLCGAAGVLSVLLAAISDEPSPLDPFLMANIPGRAPR